PENGPAGHLRAWAGWGHFEGRLTPRFTTIQVRLKDSRALPVRPEPAKAGTAGSGGEAHARRKTTPDARRGGDMAARRACPIGSTRYWLSEESVIGLRELYAGRIPPRRDREKSPLPGGPTARQNEVGLAGSRRSLMPRTRPGAPILQLQSRCAPCSRSFLCNCAKKVYNIYSRDTLR